MTTRIISHLLEATVREALRKEPYIDKQLQIVPRAFLSKRAATVAVEFAAKFTSIPQTEVFLGHSPHVFDIGKKGDYHTVGREGTHIGDTAHAGILQLVHVLHYKIDRVSRR